MGAGAGAHAPPPPPPPAAPSATELHRDSRLAKLSGLCYKPEAELALKLPQHGLQLVAHGKTHFTAWYVARPAPGAAGPAWWLGGPAAQQAAGQQAAAQKAQPPLQPQQEQAAAAGAAPPLFVFLRGVSWSRSADMDTLRVWQSLVQALPTPFQPHLTVPPELLVAHSGVAGMAEHLFEELRPHLEGAPSVHLAGHSLGGSLATLLAVSTHLRLHGGGGSGGKSGSDGDERQQGVLCTTFGSPPVLALAGPGGEDGRALLQAARLPLGAFRNYVLQDDPVPRALLSADPAFLALQQSPVVAGLLRLREQWLGRGALSPRRFLFHPAGDVYLVRWSAEGGHSVRLLAPDTLQEELKLDVSALRTSPLAILQAILDHHHGSYSNELLAAAVTAAGGASPPSAPAAAAAAAAGPAGKAASAASAAAAEFPGSAASSA